MIIVYRPGRALGVPEAAKINLCPRLADLCYMTHKSATWTSPAGIFDATAIREPGAWIFIKRKTARQKRRAQYMKQKGKT